MSQTKTSRIEKRQLGQFYTPVALAKRLVDEVVLTARTTVLEPSAGDGAFVLPLIERFMALHEGSERERLRRVLTENVFAIEIDRKAHASLLGAIERRWGGLPEQHNLLCGDFFVTDFHAPPEGNFLFSDQRRFDVILGNPPFGGTIEPRLQDQLDGRYGERDGLKIKKETYSFFIVRSVELLRPGGQLRFICSDTFLTIPTMKGLREFLLNRGRASVSTIDVNFEETTQPMVVLDFAAIGRTQQVEIDGRQLRRETINLTGNRSWQITESLGPLFSGPKLGDFMVASSGMTIGKNELFVRDIRDGCITEHLSFRFRDEPITLSRETARARLGYLPAARIAEILRQERAGETRRNVEFVPLENPELIRLPHHDYCFYNKACGDIIYAPPRWVVFWKDDGDAVKTFKKNGNWYLHGVGGQSFFKREGLSWQLVSPTLNARYLPPGYILDSGAPCAFLRDGVDSDELWFILGWCLTPLCTKVLKDVLNHTRNIQSKDFERLPYPFWVGPELKMQAIRRCKDMVAAAVRGERCFGRTDAELIELVACFEPSRGRGGANPVAGGPSTLAMCHDHRLL